MQADLHVNKVLNKQLSYLLTAINQYFLHARMLKNWGFDELGEREYKKSIRDMKDADKVIQRIFLLEGLPNLQELLKVRVGENVPDILSCNLALEVERHENLISAMEHCEKVEDFVSREILRKLLEQNEDQIDYLETQQELIESMELENYLQSSVSDD